jgi:hypothetical protein
VRSAEGPSKRSSNEPGRALPSRSTGGLPRRRSRTPNPLAPSTTGTSAGACATMRRALGARPATHFGPASHQHGGNALTPPAWALGGGAAPIPEPFLSHARDRGRACTPFGALEPESGHPEANEAERRHFGKLRTGRMGPLGLVQEPGDKLGGN